MPTRDPECHFCAATCYDAVLAESCGGDFTVGSAILRLIGAALTRIGMGCVGETWWSLLNSAASGPGQRFVGGEGGGGRGFVPILCARASTRASFSPTVGVHKAAWMRCERTERRLVLPSISHGSGGAVMYP